MGKSTSSSHPSKKRHENPNNSTNNNSSSDLTKRTKTTAMDTAAYDGDEETEYHHQQRERLPLSEVVSDCIQRWFEDTLKEAKSGDVNMQVLVSQMYYCGYGVPKDAKKGKIWMTRAARVRSSVWKVSNKRPGYNASDSDSDELAGDS